MPDLRRIRCLHQQTAVLKGGAPHSDVCFLLCIDISTINDSCTMYTATWLSMGHHLEVLVGSSQLESGDYNQVASGLTLLTTYPTFAVVSAKVPLLSEMKHEVTWSIYCSTCLLAVSLSSLHLFTWSTIYMLISARDIWPMVGTIVVMPAVLAITMPVSCSVAACYTTLVNQNVPATSGYKYSSIAIICIHKAMFQVMHSPRKWQKFISSANNISSSNNVWYTIYIPSFICCN